MQCSCMPYLLSTPGKCLAYRDSSSPAVSGPQAPDSRFRSFSPSTTIISQDEPVTSFLERNVIMSSNTGQGRWVSIGFYLGPTPGKWASPRPRAQFPSAHNHHFCSLETASMTEEDIVVDTNRRTYHKCLENCLGSCSAAIICSL